MRKFLSYIRVVLTAGAGVLYYHLTRFIRYSKKPAKYPLNKRYLFAHKMMDNVISRFHCELHIEGLENVEACKGKVLFISNHLSEADPLVYVTLFNKPITFAAKKETLDMPFVGKVLQAIEGIPLNRGNIMGQLSEIKHIVEMIKSEDKPNVFIFAEGTRNKEPANPCLEFKGGSIKMGYMAKTPIIPVSIYGTQRILSIKHYLKKYPVYIKFGKPVMPEEYENIPSVDLADKFRNEINNNVDHFRYLDSLEVAKQKISRKRKMFEIQDDKRGLAS